MQSTVSLAKARWSQAVFAVAVLAVAALAIPAAAQAGPLTIPHDGLVPEVPRIDLPQILDGDVLDVAIVGPYIIAGGNFTTIEYNDGTTTSQPYLAAFDVDTGALVESFRPVLNGEVRAIEPGYTADEVFIGGTFTQIGGVTRNRLAKLNLSDGSVNSWKANASGMVQEIHISPQGRLFVGGLFGTVKGISIDRVAELDPATGSPKTVFNFDFSGEGGTRSGGQNIKHLQVTPDGTKLLVVHTARYIDGNERKAAAIFDIADPNAPFLTDYNISNYFIGAPYGALPTDADMSPDGSFFAIGTIIGWNPPWHDAVIAFPMSGGANTQPIWQHTMRDSVYSIAISNNAVYAGGHFCRIDSGPGATNDLGNGFTDKVCSGSPTAGAWRWQVAALDPADGTPLDWDPGSNSFHGVVTLEVTDRGLLLGHDGSYAGTKYTGRLAFFDFGAGALDTEAPTVAITAPTGVVAEASPVTVSGTTADNVRTERVKVRVIQSFTGLYLQPDGTFSATLHEFVVFPEIVGPNETASWNTSFAVAPDQYRIEARAVDGADNVSVAETVVFEVVGDPTCGVELNGAGLPKITWDPVPGEDTYFVRRNGGFLATVQNAETYTDLKPAVGVNDYLVRSFQNGVVTNLECGAVTIDPPPDPTCSLALDGLGGVVVTWDEIPGEDRYFVRRDGAFRATVVNELSYTDTTATPGTHTYLVRSFLGGVTSNVDCGSIVV